jgi:CelD/BcsL family acetyltransferase involved in cellulose biosynthesis
MKVEAFSRSDGMDAGAWNDLARISRSGSVFLTWQWQTLWARHFAAERPIELLAVTDASGAVTGLLPLYEDAPGRLRILGGTDVSDYLDALAAPGLEEAVWHALLEHRAAEPVLWDLHCIRAASPTLALVPGLAPAHGLQARIEREERCPVLRLPATWDEYLAALSGKDRHELRRKMRRLERELPGAAVRDHARPDGWDAAMSEFLRLHRLSKAGKERFMGERMERFFREATAALAAAGWARLWFLDWDGAAVASFLCVEYAEVVGLYNSGFDPAHARLAPGIVLLAHVIQDAIGRRITTFDFLRGEEPYKSAFGPTPEDLFNIRVSPA